MNKNQKLSTRAALAAQSVRLDFFHPTATKVCLAGTFNEWRPAATPMVSLGAGCWVKTLTLPPGIYEYRLVVDGEWLPDPSATKTTSNPFGGLNSVIQVPDSPASLTEPPPTK